MSRTFSSGLLQGSVLKLKPVFQTGLMRSFYKLYKWRGEKRQGVLTGKHAQGDFGSAFRKPFCRKRPGNRRKTRDILSHKRECTLREMEAKSVTNERSGWTIWERCHPFCKLNFICMGREETAITQPWVLLLIACYFFCHELLYSTSSGLDIYCCASLMSCKLYMCHTGSVYVLSCYIVHCPKWP